MNVNCNPSTKNIRLLYKASQEDNYPPFMGNHLSRKVGKITNVSLHGDSYPPPTFSWMSSSGGKPGIWTVKYTSGKFTATSTIFPTLKSHIDEYKALVRNSEGSVEIIIILNVYEPEVIVDSMVPCNTSNDMSLTCSINITHTTYGTTAGGITETTFSYVLILDLIPRWFQYGQSNIVITRMPGSMFVPGNTTSLMLQRHQLWLFMTGYIQNEYDYRGTHMDIVRLLFFTSSLPFEVKWYINDTHIKQNTSSTIKIANVSLICYDKNISTDGYRSDFLLTNSNGSHLKMNCHIKNQYDSVEGSFENIWSAMSNVIGSTDMDLTETIVSTDSMNRQSKGKLDMSVNAEREHARESHPPLEIQNESQYEEIDDRSYNSVTWRNYDLDATSSLDVSTDDSDRNSQIEMYNSILNVYVELENSQPDTHHYQSTILYENSLVKFKGVPNTTPKKKTLPFNFSCFYLIDKLGLAEHHVNFFKDLNRW
ncbi:unnamed protein product [Mytilus coruscus]|uniref:Uncharacterized protein n=1 Tax=Mytilus coruscus TaxID=42192 RepID=A0A6J8C854_MYTCO|nr:unnamed protein product [Mytilus coruscus]